MPNNKVVDLAAWVPHTYCTMHGLQRVFVSQNVPCTGVYRKLCTAFTIPLGDAYYLYNMQILFFKIVPVHF